MTSWLIDTALLKSLASPRPTAFQRWCDTHDASLFLSAASLTEISAGIAKMGSGRSHRAEAMREWVREIALHFADRIHPIETEISVRAGALLPHLAHAQPRHRLHDALLVATAQAHGHGLLTRRDGVFGSWTQTPVAII